jgi:tol-pal system protein YbgF
MKTTSAFIVFFCMILVYGCVATDELSILRSRLDTLEQRIEKQEAQLSAEEKQSIHLESRVNKLSETTAGKEENDRNASAELNATIDQIRGDFQSLRGKVEEAEYSMRQQQSSVQATGGEQLGRLARTEAVSQKNEDSLFRIEQYFNLESLGRKPARPITAPTTPKTLTEDEIYRSAKQAFDSADYEKARLGFGSFLKKYPKSENSDNAQFWIGETYYREKWYEKAILEYQKAIETYPKGNKVPASLLKQGLAFLNLGDKSNSRLILKELVKKYPKSNESKVAIQKLKDIK